ncbi:MarR family winged helix-turn-helix transcriptional regulator [Alicyclobacillus dauci]|uniref:MarR family transcriptional regulator n=1 Tax=Alicyclobacillus dauci TaxID=1475485 RepID=A0ABY6Z9R5_9BACL|nr:MarR family transcriptional regulator [Alicyclobacillus dauci]WAH38906.1 MarR family transcriptional regulator [Alicyclobacillus dauci]
MNSSDNMENVSRLDTILERLVRIMKTRSEPIGLTTTQFFVLRYLDFTQQAKSSDLARIAGLSPGAITQVCDELVRLGFVERVRSKEDRRVVFVELTEAGRSKLKAILSQRAIRLGQLMDKLGAEDANRLIELLERLVGILNAESKS